MGLCCILLDMKVLVGHQAADLDCLMSMWIIRRFLPGWDMCELEFVPAGERFVGEYVREGETIEELSDGREVITVDTGMGKLDHHQTEDMDLCAARLAFEYALTDSESTLNAHDTKRESVARMVEFAVDIDHFQELYYPNSESDVIDMGIVGVIDGYKMTHEYNDHALAEYIFEALDAILHTLEAKIFAEHEISEHGVDFESIFGRALSIETVNDSVMKEALKMGYEVVVRRDPNHGFIRIKAKPERRKAGRESRSFEDVQGDSSRGGVDLTPVYEVLVREDPDATWFLHASKKMLLNGSSKNPKSRPTRLSLEEVVAMMK